LAQRYGSPKILIDWHGKPLIRHVAESVLACDLSPVIIVVGATVETAHEALVGCPVDVIENMDYQLGLGTSFSVGIRAVKDDVDGSFIFLCDHPFIDKKLVDCMKSMSAQSEVIVPTYNGFPGHPVLWNKKTFARIHQMTTGETGQSLQKEFKSIKFPWSSNLITFDIDTPEDYEYLLNNFQE
jgi:molybdenum cofactor cytidylyltransferase